MHHQKGVHFDGHDRSDVVTYRNDFLNKMEEFDRSPLLTMAMSRNWKEGIYLSFGLFMTRARFTPIAISHTSRETRALMCYNKSH